MTWSYIARGRVLARTVRRAHPDWGLWAVLVDRPPDDVPLDEILAGFDRVLLAEELGIPRFRAWLFKHDLVEACTAVKGAMLRHLLTIGAECVVYLDPDIAVFHPLDAVMKAAADADIVFTPHQIVPSATPQARADNEAASLRVGVFNLGFLLVRNTAAGLAFAHWWAARLHEACYDAPEQGLFVDQKYCDLEPALFAASASCAIPAATSRAGIWRTGNSRSAPTDPSRSIGPRSSSTISAKAPARAMR